MCRTQSWIGWRAPVLALATIALAASAAGAAQMTSGLAYGTTGSIGTEGMLGMPAVRFHSVDHGKQGLGASFSLGEFEVSAAVRSPDHDLRWDAVHPHVQRPFGSRGSAARRPREPLRDGLRLGQAEPAGDSRRPVVPARPVGVGSSIPDRGRDPYPGPQPAAEREPGPDPGDGTVRSRAVPRAVLLGPVPRRRRVRRIAPPDRSLAQGRPPGPHVPNPAGPPTPRPPAPPCRGAFFRTWPTFTAAPGTQARTPRSLISGADRIFCATPLQFINAGSQSQ